MQVREYCFFFGQNRLHSLERKLYTLAEFFTLQASPPGPAGDMEYTIRALPQHRTAESVGRALIALRWVSAVGCSRAVGMPAGLTLGDGCPTADRQRLTPLCIAAPTRLRWGGRCGADRIGRSL